jgi:hypothetical protein
MSRLIYLLLLIPALSFAADPATPVTPPSGGVSDLLDAVLNIADWVNGGITQWFQGAIGWVFTKLLIWWIETKIWSMQFAWGVAQAVLTSTNISQTIRDAWGLLPGSVLSALTLFRVPEAVNILLSAVIARFTLNWMPFL